MLSGELHVGDGAALKREHLVDDVAIAAPSSLGARLTASISG